MSDISVQPERVELMEGSGSSVIEILEEEKCKPLSSNTHLKTPNPFVSPKFKTVTRDILTDKCKSCARYWSRKDNVWQFNEISDIKGLANISFRGKQHSSADPKICLNCYSKKYRCCMCDVEIEKIGEAVIEPKKQSASSEKLGFNYYCEKCKDQRENVLPEPLCEPDEDNGTARAHNPLWTGEDNSQIGIFIRNLRIVGLDEGKKTITLQFFLNVCWLDRELWEFIRKGKDICKNDHVKLSYEEYEKFWRTFKDHREAEDDYHSNVVPEIKIWDVVAGGMEVRQNTISLNKKWIGDNTVYWRRLVNVELKNSFCSSTYPFGYERFKLTFRLISYTKQHLTLMRTDLWYQEHAKQAGLDIAAHTFAYIVPDKTFMIDWKVCSVHGFKDRWYSKFDHNDLTYRLPVTVSRGLDTQSRYEAWVILKRRPRSVLFIYWVWYSLTSFIALLTWKLKPMEDLPDLLAIAVGIIFIQMGLKIHSASKTPRMPNITALDIHSFCAVLLVVYQATSQVLVVAYFEGNDESEGSSQLSKVSRNMAWINTGLVVFVNVVIFSYAKCRQRQQKKTLEKMLKTLTGFNKKELEYVNEDRQPLVFDLKGHTDREQPIKITEQELNHRIMKIKYYKQQSLGTKTPAAKWCGCCCSLNRENFG